MDIVFAVEVWTFAGADPEEPAPTEMVECKEFDFGDSASASRWAWDQMEAGFFARMFRRPRTEADS